MKRMEVTTVGILKENFNNANLKLDKETHQFDLQKPEDLIRYVITSSVHKKERMIEKEKQEQAQKQAKKDQMWK